MLRGPSLRSSRAWVEPSDAFTEVPFAIGITKKRRRCLSRLISSISSSCCSALGETNCRISGDSGLLQDEVVYAG
jgi:hypothetical protein